MKNIILDMPSMFADHHVLAVRDALTGLSGVDTVYASSAWKQVMISYDPKKITPEAIQEALENAGYPPGKGETPMLVEATPIKRDPRWEVLGMRSTVTYRADIDMSGEFRRY